MYDAIVIGAGNQGLTCAAFLARAGQRVLVLEAREDLGGFSATQEMVPTAPGYRMNPYSIDLIFTSMGRRVAAELQLERHGLRTLPLDPYGAIVTPDGEPVTIWCDLSRTVEGIKRLSRRDAQRYEELAEVVAAFWKMAIPYLQTHPTRPEPRAVAQCLWHAIRGRKQLGRMARLLLSSPLEVIEEWFERDELRMVFAQWAASAMAPLTQSGTALTMGMITLPHFWRAERPVGGMGAWAGALARCTMAHGGEVRSGAPVSTITIENGAARGVVLENGEAILGRNVIAAVDPVTLFSRMVHPSLLPVPLQEELRAMPVLAQNISWLKLDVALADRPKLRAGQSDEILAGGYLFLGESYAAVKRQVEASARGELSDEVCMWAAVPSVTDRSLVPAKSNGETLWIHVPSVPWELRSSSWADEKDGYTKRCLKALDMYLPDTGKSVIGVTATGPQELSPWVHKASPLHVDMGLGRFGPWRPSPSLAGYRTPFEGLWHSGGGAHPMPGVSGWSGRTTARAVVKSVGRSL